MILLKLVFLSIVLHNVCGYNILVVFPYHAASHAILGEGYVKNLLKAGHEVTYVTANLLKPHPKLKQVDVSSNVPVFNKNFETTLNFNNFLINGNALSDIGKVYEMMLFIGNTSITHENVQKFLMESTDKYDVVISEWLYHELYCGFAAVFDVPHIWSTSMEPHPAILSLIDEPQNPAYFADHMTPVSLPMTFTERVKELWGLAYLYYVRGRLREAGEKVFREAYGPAAAKRGITLPTLETFKYESSLMLGNSYVASGEAHKLPQSYIPIAGYHIDNDIKPLPENIQKIMDNSPNGVIYFSMGTRVKSKTMPESLKRDIIKVFSELKQNVIWKFEENMTDLPNNVHIVHWAPQQSILAHPNCVLFITHGGLLSTTETLHFGVPIIGIPIFADQPINVHRAVEKGFGLGVDLNYDTPANMKVAIDQMLNNPKYRERVKELSFIYHHRPTSPGASLVHWVEHVIQTKGAPHLRSPASRVPLYQKFFLDLIGLIIIGIVSLAWIVKKLLFRSKSVSKKKKQ